jgi:hypothetical protein
MERVLWINPVGAENLCHQAILNRGGLQKGARSGRVLARKPWEETWPVLHPLELRLDQGGQLYAVVFPRGLRASLEMPAREFPAASGGCAPLPAQIRQVRAGGIFNFKRRKTPVPRVLLSVPLAGPALSCCTGPSRLCQGCSHPPRRHPDKAALSSTPLLRQGKR